MNRIRTIHPSAALFAGILIVFTLPFGYSTASCGPSTQEYRGVDLLRAHVEPDADSPEGREYAESVAREGVFFGGLLAGSALLGLGLAVFREGRLWGTCCAVAASLALLLGLAIDLADADIGWQLALFIPLGGFVLRVLLAIVRLVSRRLAPSVTTPEEPAVR